VMGVEWTIVVVVVMLGVGWYMFNKEDKDD
jgi:cbb3-type cytochrome oxidase subunit 3